MAKFYTQEFDGCIVSAKAKAGRILRAIPYRSDTRIPFRVVVKYSKGVSDDYREFFLTANEHQIGKVHSEDNQGELYQGEFISPVEHDDKEQIIWINFPRRGSSHRLIRSVPLGSNFWFATVITASIATVFALFAPKLIAYAWSFIVTSLAR